MQEYIQDTITYERTYSQSGLFITFKFNPNWDEVNITARVFKWVSKLFMNLITYHSVYGETRCLMYFVEKIRPEQIDKIMSVDITDWNIVEELFAIVTANMILPVL